MCRQVLHLIGENLYHFRIRITSVDQFLITNLQSGGSGVVIDWNGGWMWCLWGSLGVGQQLTPLEHVGDVELSGMNWVHTWMGHLYYRPTCTLVNQLKTTNPEQ